MLKKIIIGVIVTVCLGFGLLMGAVFFSPLPFKLIAGGLEEKGIRMEGVGGSLNSGITVEKLFVDNPMYTFEFEGAQFLWSDFFKTFVERKVVVELLEARKGLIVIKAPAGGVAPPNAPVDPAVPQPPATAETPVAPAEPMPSPFRSVSNPDGFDEFRIDKISLNNLTVKDLGRNKEFFLKELAMEGLLATEPSTVLKSLLIDSDQFAFSLTNASWTKGVFDLKNPVKGTIKVAAVPDRLRKDLKFSVFGKFNGSTPESLEVKLDGEKILVKGDAKGVTVEINEFTPAELFVTEFPLKLIKAKANTVEVVSAMQAAIPLEGEVQIGKQTFQVALSNARWVATGAVGAKKYKVFVPTGSLMMSAMTGSAVGMLEVSGPSKSLEKNLADIFFQKPVDQLTPEEKVELEKLNSYFKAADLPEAEMIPIAEDETPKPQVAAKRAPASLKQKKLAIKGKAAVKRKRK